MTDFPKLSEGILGEETVEKTNTEKFLELVGQYFPEAIKDGEVDFTALKEEMGEFAEVGAEHYDFTWAGKQAAKKEAMADIFGRSLRYKPQDSLNPDSTENLYIEGDNLEALKLLRRNYHGRIKMIYIDPPYNTGSDLIYRDDFSMTQEELDSISDVFDDEGNRLQKNVESDARFHTNWLNLLYPRLKMAKEFLSDNGVIFISIDDNEVDNLRKICNDIFGAYNFIAQFSVIVKTEGRRYGGVAKTHEYILAYAKNNDIAELNEIEIEGKKFQYFDDEGGFNVQELRNQNARAFNSTNRPNLRYPFYVDINNVDKNGFCKVFLEQTGNLEEVYPITVNGFESVWRWGRKEKATQFLNQLIARKGSDNIIRIYQKMRKLTEMPKTVLMDKNYISIKGTRELQEIIGLGVFDFPKPTKLIKLLLTVGTSDNDIILDFFSGSATTAHAVMQLNAEDGGHRKYIMVQLPELTDENSEAYKAGYKNICEIGKERIRRAAKKIHEEHPEAQFDDGFKVFEVGETTIRWSKMDDDSLLDIERYSDDKDKIDFTDNYSDTDIVYEIMLRQYGIPLSTPIEKLDSISDRTYIFADSVVVCLEPEITTELIEKLAAIEPTPAKYILRDSAFNDDIELKDVSFRRLSALVQNHQPEAIRKSKYNNFTVEFI